MPGHGGNRTYDLWNTSPTLCQLSYAVRSVRVCDISELSLVPSISVKSNNHDIYSECISTPGRLEKYRGQAYFSSLPGVDIHSE